MTRGIEKKKSSPNRQKFDEYTLKQACLYRSFYTVHMYRQITIPTNMLVEDLLDLWPFNMTVGNEAVIFDVIYACTHLDMARSRRLCSHWLSPHTERPHWLVWGWRSSDTSPAARGHRWWSTSTNPTTPSSYRSLQEIRIEHVVIKTLSLSLSLSLSLRISLSPAYQDWNLQFVLKMSMYLIIILEILKILSKDVTVQFPLILVRILPMNRP